MITSSIKSWKDCPFFEEKRKGMKGFVTYVKDLPQRKPLNIVRRQMPGSANAYKLLK